MPPKGTYPDGMDVEVFSFQKLQRVWHEAKKPSAREHVTFYFIQHPELFSIFRHDLPEDLSKYRLTVDYLEDFEIVKAILNSLYSKNPLFTLGDIIDFLESNPEIFNINAHIKSNQGWHSAYEKDKNAGFIT